MTFYLPAIRPSLVCLLAVTSLLIAPYANSATTWQTINSNIQFLKQAHKLRFYDSNQVLIEGEKCALLFDASGNFAADEQLAKDLKKRLKTPLCYLVASHYHDDHLLGMAVIQHFYPNAKLIVHQYVDTNFNEFQKAYNDKLDNYEKSIELSYQRLAKVTEEEQAQWRKKLELAKNRLFRWQTYQLKSPSIVIKKIKKIDLAAFRIEGKMTYGRSKYQPLQEYFETLPKDRSNVELTFEEIEQILEEKLPKAARNHGWWWDNEDPETTQHVQCKSWQSAGWNVSQVNLPGKWVSFKRT